MSAPPQMNSPLFEIARVLVRFNHVARCILNADHCDLSGCELEL